jgi:3-oxoacyl-[acyl-carrier-protein] synthase II
LIAAADPQGEATLAISGASGAHKPTRAEREALEAGGGRAIRAFSSLTGHLKEAQFPFAVALASLAIQSGNAYPPFDTESEKAFTGKLDAVLATTVGFSQAEGAALLTSA